MTTATTKAARGGSRTGKTLQRPPKSGATQAGKGRPSHFHRLINAKVVRQISEFGDVISVVDAAEILGVTTQTARQWSKRGLLPAAFVDISRFGDQKLYMRTPDVVRALENALQQAGATQQ